MVRRIMLGKSFWVMNTCTHISNNLLHKSLTRVFRNNELFIFYCNNSASFESVFCEKTVKSILFKKYLERRKSQTRFGLSLSWLRISEKKIIENCNFIGTGAQNVGEVVSFWPKFDPNFTDIWRT